MKTKEIDILDILIILAKHKKFIFWTTFIVSIAAVVFSLVTPEIWTSTATILPYQSESKNIQLSSILGGIGSSILGGGQENCIELITIMHSRYFSENVINKFNLIEYFKIKETDSLKSIDTALIYLKDIVSIYLNDESGTISISIKTNNKKLSADIANYYIDEVDFVNRKIRINKSRRNREFIEKRVQEIEMEIDSLMVKLNTFQNENNIIHIEEQTKSVIQLYTELISEKTKIEIQLEFHEFSSNKNPQIAKDLLDRKGIIERKIESIEQSSNILNPAYQMSLDDISEMSIEYAKIEMQSKIKEKVYEFLVPEYEAAKIEEIRNLPSIEIIDKAYPAGFRTSPKRAKMCLIAIIIGMLFSSLIVIIKSSLTENQLKKADHLRSLLFKKY
ncbi:MAG: Wzz/FepE/Etk N-terminal domain-containing protein [Candidatus Cloacimonadales bacterium]|nr:Wzz/FepE/Etk N-terminal domain-containing protein [Candidatus Cloacimonadales bacterium]